MPDEAGQAAARANVQAVLKEELAGATTATKKVALTKELRRLARLGDDQANRYALLQEAVKAAVEAVRFDLALEIADEIGEDFEADPLPAENGGSEGRPGQVPQVPGAGSGGRSHTAVAGRGGGRGSV